MQSQPYLQASTVRYPVESGGPEWLLREISEEKNKLGEGEMDCQKIKIKSISFSAKIL